MQENIADVAAGLLTSSEMSDLMYAHYLPEILIVIKLSMLHPHMSLCLGNVAMLGKLYRTSGDKPVIGFNERQQYWAILGNIGKKRSTVAKCFE